MPTFALPAPLLAPSRTALGFGLAIVLGVSASPALAADASPDTAVTIAASSVPLVIAAGSTSALVPVSGQAGIGGLGGLGGLGALGTVNAESPTLTGSVERRLAPKHWLGVTIGLSYADNASRTAAGDSGSTADVESQSLGASAALAWRYVWNPDSRVEVGPYVFLGYRRQTSDARTTLLDANGDETQASTASASSQAVAAGAGMNLDAHLAEHVGLRLSVQVLEASWSSQRSESETEGANSSPSVVQSRRIGAGLSLAPSLGLRVRF